MSLLSEIRPSPARRRRWRHTVLGSGGPRRYLAGHLTLETFFRTLDEAEVPYAVLRWFETLPHVDPGEDIDLLIADECLDFVHTLLRPRPAGPRSQAFDVYTVSGLPGTDFGAGVPYYPPEFAQRLLAEAVDSGVCRVPKPLHHLQSLAYHAAYHKGYACGLAPDAGSPPQVDGADHDYAGVLSDLAHRLDVPTEPTLDALDRMLADAGLRPPLDTLERLSDNNPWIRERLTTERPAADERWNGLAVFVVRERAAAQRDVIAAELDRHGFEILDAVRLTPDQVERASRRIRGGNWGRGPWPVSGGGPSDFVIAYDVAPWRDSTDGVTGVNLRIAEAKAKVRERLLADDDAQYNPLHSSDNLHQALDYLDVLDDAPTVRRWLDRATALREQCRMPFPVIRWVTPGGPPPGAGARRARTAIVDHPDHGPSFCKVYRPGALRYFRREIYARQDLTGVPHLPALLDQGENWFVSPVYTDDRSHALRRLPFDNGYENAFQLTTAATRTLLDLARSLHDRGLFLLDLTTENVFSDPEAGLTVLDLEFLQEYAEPVPAFADSYTLRGVPDEVAHRYDQPQSVPFTGDGVGNPVFHPAVCGLPVHRLLDSGGSGASLTAFRRSITRWAWYLYLGVVRPPHRLNAVLNRYRWGRVAKRVVKGVVTRGLAVTRRRDRRRDRHRIPPRP